MMTNPLETLWNSLMPIHEYFRFEKKFLRPTAFLVWSALLAHSIPKTGLVSATNGEIAEWTGLSPKVTVRRALQELIQNRYLVRFHVPNRSRPHSTLYRLLPVPGKDPLLDMVKFPPEVFSQALDKLAEEIKIEIGESKVSQGLDLAQARTRKLKKSNPELWNQAAKTAE